MSKKLSAERLAEIRELNQWEGVQQYMQERYDLLARIAELEAERDEIWRALKAIINTLEETGRKE
jgi:hypothetical protein